MPKASTTRVQTPHTIKTNNKVQKLALKSYPRPVKTKQIKPHSEIKSSNHNKNANIRGKIP